MSIEITINTGISCCRNVSAIVEDMTHTGDSFANIILD